MSNWFNFIETEPKNPCAYCGRKKLNENEKFYKVFLGDEYSGITVCEFCKGGYLTWAKEGSEKTYGTHFTFYVKRKFFEIRERLPGAIKGDLDSAVENYENGNYSVSFRNIGLIAEWLTEKLFIKKLGKKLVGEIPKWEDRLGRLLSEARENKKFPEETLIYQLFSLKWLRNKVDHPSEYEITEEDVRLGLLSILYVFHQAYSYKLV